jgi:hypothetical protein
MIYDAQCPWNASFCTRFECVRAFQFAKKILLAEIVKLIKCFLSRRHISIVTLFRCYKYEKECLMIVFVLSINMQKQFKWITSKPSRTFSRRKYIQLYFIFSEQHFIYFLAVMSMYCISVFETAFLLLLRTTVMCTAHYIIRTVKSRGTRWARHFASV